MLLSVSAYATDWRVYGENSAKEELMLYSASDLARDGDNVRVWTEVISEKDVTRFLDANKKHPEKIAQEVADRMKAGYVPPYAEHADAQMAAAVALAEEVADEQAAPVRSRALYEVDCAGGRFRILQFSSFLPKPETHLTVPLPWEYTAPDTVAATMKSSVCTRS
jgi:hypothetical protein